MLGTVAGVVGLAAAGWGMRWALELLRGELTDGSGNYPFWVDGTLSPLTFVYTALLTLLAAAVSGVLPGLRITRNLGELLKRATAGGGASPARRARRGPPCRRLVAARVLRRARARPGAPRRLRRSTSMMSCRCGRPCRTSGTPVRLVRT